MFPIISVESILAHIWWDLTRFQMYEIIIARVQIPYRIPWFESYNITRGVWGFESSNVSAFFVPLQMDIRSCTRSSMYIRKAAT